MPKALDFYADIIAAPATPPGRGAVAVVRVSGPNLKSLALRLTRKSDFKPRYAHYAPFLDENGSAIDRGLILYFPAPHSYTGEDMLELHCHGSPVVVEMLLRRLFALGARPAEPGEFSRRAFLNGKLDLAQAEAVAALIESASEEAARAAQRSLEGMFSERVHKLSQALLELRAYVEASIDFSDQEIDLLAEGEVEARLQSLLEDLETLRRRAQQGRLLREGMTAVIAGPPNVGKSSLLNRLAGREAAIVTDIAGTTRDLLTEHLNFDGMPCTVIDTAGLRSGGDSIEREGMRRAIQAMQSADRILLVLDCRQTQAEEFMMAQLPCGVPVTKVYNKIDLGGLSPGLEEAATSVVYLSAKTGAGIDLLKSHLMHVMGFEAEREDALAARRRHLEALIRTQDFLQRAWDELRHTQAAELVAENLRLAQQRLAEITGEVTNEDLLGEIFAEFCIGK
ncbi:MAG: tRNA uridine-5-carboxymethylaminomethyl(34) synthesis GTPase MnmE [Methylohalobius sp.]|nr:tRNA uridine-5-carboxymethylaminomethyl(34) synthesis GTPase MnmE [Methylohalobius sp.]